MTKPLITVFIDGLRPDWVEEHMPFVRSKAAVRPLETVFGYSISCHATMYTGTSVQEHGLWFVWLRDRTRSIFPSWLARVPRALDSIPTRLLFRKLLLRRLGSRGLPRGFFGLPRLINVPFSSWPGLWVSEERYWDEDGYVPGHPTLFELARQAGIRHHVIGMQRGAQLPIVEAAPDLGDASADWYYLFIGEVDHLAHYTAGEGHEFAELLQRCDRAVERWCNAVEKAHGGYDFVLFSDHGHVPSPNKVDLYERLPKRLTRGIPHIVDTNFARFWSKSPQQREELVAALGDNMPEGWVLSEAEMRTWDCWFSDDRFGDVVFYLDRPSVFARTAWGFSRSQKSIHGYLPTYPEMNGVIVSTLDGGQPVNHLRDIFRLHLERLGLDAPRAAAVGP